MSTSSTFVGIEIGGTKIQVVLGDGELRILRRWRGEVDRAQGAAGIRRQLEQGLAEVRCGAAAGVGVGFGGPIDVRTGRIQCSHQIGGWNDFALKTWLSDRTGLPVAVDNDANVAALGESAAGAGRDANPLFYITLGSGVGGGLIVDGSIYHGLPPGEAEFGHLRLDRAGTTVEQRCSGWAIDARIRALQSACPQSLLAQSLAPQPGGEAKLLPPALAQGDQAARQILDELAEDLALALSHAIHLFHPQAVILGGGLSLLGEALRAAVAAQVPRFVMDAFKPGPIIRLAQLGEDTVPIGALKLASTLA